ncbi:MAG: hypothetical protein KBG38_08495 [Candidatus Cloacimonas sp.]|jgi:hypothetical protein|nr:hypothetical protein [Candidatus Cloacimonas sp.]
MARTKKGKKDPNILTKFTITDVVLKKLSAELINPSPDFDKIESVIGWSFDIEEHKENAITLNAIFNVSHEPEDYFNIEAEYSVVLHCDEPIFTLETINLNSEYFLTPVGHINSMLLGPICDKMLGYPVIFSPRIHLSDD